MPFVFIGSTNIIIDGLGLARYDEHVKAWKWSMYVAGKFKYLNGRIVYNA